MFRHSNTETTLFRQDEYTKKGDAAKCRKSIQQSVVIRDRRQLFARIRGGEHFPHALLATKTETIKQDCRFIITTGLVIQRLWAMIDSAFHPSRHFFEPSGKPLCHAT
jgi:hypothetical protein